jgi:hypothetical protein
MRSSRALFLFLSIFASTASLAQIPSRPEKTRDNLMVVVRESRGANRPEDAFQPTGKITVKLSDGRVFETETASWEYIGDIHVRFVFDGPRMMLNATPQDFFRLGLSGVDDALPLALENIKRVYGEPSAKPWEGGVMQVQGKSADLDSSYFLDRAYWQQLLKGHPEGLVVAVPKRGGLLYASLSDTKAVERLKNGVAYLHSSSDSQRVSSALFLFKDGKWSVFQSPVEQ